jgi:hypothetical protein
VKRLLQTFPSILRIGDVMPTPTHGVEHHIHTGSHPPVIAKSRRLDPEKLEIAKAKFKITMGVFLAHGAQKIWTLATLWSLLPSQFSKGGDSAILVRTSAIPQYCGVPNRLRNCGLKKVAELRLRTFKI